MEIKKKYLKFCKRIIVIVLWFIVLFGVYNGYNYNKYWKEHPETRYEAETGGDFPEEMYIKIDLHNKVVTNVYVALFFIIIYFIVDYFYDPEKHFYTIYIKKWVSKLSKMEDDEDGKD